MKNYFKFITRKISANKKVVGVQLFVSFIVLATYYFFSLGYFDLLGVILLLGFIIIVLFLFYMFVFTFEFISERNKYIVIPILVLSFVALLAFSWILIEEFVAGIYSLLNQDFTEEDSSNLLSLIEITAYVTIPLIVVRLTINSTWDSIKYQQKSQYTPLIIITDEEQKEVKDKRFFKLCRKDKELARHCSQGKSIYIVNPYDNPARDIKVSDFVIQISDGKRFDLINQDKDNPTVKVDTLMKNELIQLIFEDIQSIEFVIDNVNYSRANAKITFNICLSDLVMNKRLFSVDIDLEVRKPNDQERFNWKTSKILNKSIKIID